MNADEKKSCTIRVHELRLRFRVCVRIGRAHTRREREKMNLNEKKNQQQLKKNRTKLGFGGREMLIWKINADVEIVRRFRRAPAQAARIRISMHMNCEKKFKVSTQFSRQQLRRLWRVGRKRERERERSAGMPVVSGCTAAATAATNGATGQAKIPPLTRSLIVFLFCLLFEYV